MGQCRIQRHWKHWTIKNPETLGTLGNQEFRDTENIGQSRIQRHWEHWAIKNPETLRTLGTQDTGLR